MLAEFSSLQLLERFLSFVGLTAIAAFCIMWIKKMTSHTKEMQQLDKNVRDTLREAIDGVKEVRKIDKERFEIEQDRYIAELNKVNHEKRHLDNQIFYYEKLSGLVSCCCDYSINLSETLTRKTIEETCDQIYKEIDKIIHGSSLKPADFNAILSKAKESGETPSETDVRTVLFLRYLVYQLGALSALADASTYAMPIVLEEFIKSPKTDASDIWKQLATRLRSDDLPRRYCSKPKGESLA